MGYPLEETPFAERVRRDLDEARRKHARLNSQHEAFAVVAEEMSEWWDMVRLRRADRDPKAILKELVQIAAMCQRSAEDLGLIDQR